MARPTNRLAQPLTEDQKETDRIAKDFKATETSYLTRALLTRYVRLFLNKVKTNTPTSRLPALVNRVFETGTTNIVIYADGTQVPTFGELEVLCAGSSVYPIAERNDFIQYKTIDELYNALKSIDNGWFKSADNYSNVTLSKDIAASLSSFQVVTDQPDKDTRELKEKAIDETDMTFDAVYPNFEGELVTVETGIKNGKETQIAVYVGLANNNKPKMCLDALIVSKQTDGTPPVAFAFNLISAYNKLANSWKRDFIRTITDKVNRELKKSGMIDYNKRANKKLAG